MLIVPEWPSKVSVMMHSRKTLNTVGDSRHPWWTLSAIWERSSWCLEQLRWCAGGFHRELLSDLYERLSYATFPHWGPQSSCYTRSNGFLKAISWWFWLYFSHKTRRLNICTVVHLFGRKLACISAMIYSACHFSLFRMIFSITFLASLNMRLIVLPYHCNMEWKSAQHPLKMPERALKAYWVHVHHHYDFDKTSSIWLHKGPQCARHTYPIRVRVLVASSRQVLFHSMSQW